MWGARLSPERARAQTSRLDGLRRHSGSAAGLGVLVQRRGGGGGAAGRTPAKNWMALRRDLAALPWVLAGPHDVVIAPPQRPAFLAALRAAGAHGLPAFLPSVPCGRAIAGHRPYGVPGAHLRRSLVARCRDDVAVCRTGDEVRAAVARLGRPATVLKTEYSAAGFGVRKKGSLRGSYPNLKEDPPFSTSSVPWGHPPVVDLRPLPPC